MSLETISQVLSKTNATYINGVSAERRFSPAVLANAYQGLIEKDGQGVNDKFVTEDDAESAAQVFVNRILPVKMKPREMGANKNGASFSSNQHYTQTITVGIDILTVLDDPIIIPRARQDMIKVDLLAEQTKIYSDRLRTILNGATAASKLLTVYLAKDVGKDVYEKKITSSDVTNKVVLNKFIEANSLLDEGDQDNGIDLFPEDTRVAIFKPSYRATLKTSGVLVIGGANYAYDIAKGAGISTEKTSKAEDGYIGDIDGVPCRIISNESLGHASEFLGFPVNELKDNPFIGYIASSYANARGVSTSKQTKIVDAQNGQGIVLQPYTKFGVVSWYAKGNVILTNDDYSPIADIKTAVGSTAAAKITFKLKGAGSRLFPDFDADDITVANDGVTVASTVKAEDDWNTDHVEGSAAYVADEPVTTVAAFLKGYGSATYKTNDLTFGTKKSLTVAANKYVNVLVVADDGSCAIACKKNA